MKQRLKPNETAQFLGRFYGFCDTVIRSIQIQLSRNGTREIEIRLSARDSKLYENEDWTCVAISIEDVCEIKVFDERQTASLQVISDGIHLLHLENGIGIEFGGAYAPPHSLEELRASQAYAVGKRLAFELFDY